MLVLHDMTTDVEVSECRMTKRGWRKKGVPAFLRRLLLRMFANAVKTSVCVVGASLGK